MQVTIMMMITDKKKKTKTALACLLLPVPNTSEISFKKNSPLV